MDWYEREYEMLECSISRGSSRLGSLYISIAVVVLINDSDIRHYKG